MTEASLQAMSILRSPEYFQWYVVPLLAWVISMYVTEIRKKNWNAVLVGLLFSAGEFCWEMINSLILHFTGYAALWSTPGDTAYLILVGINIEILFMFSIAGLILARALPEDRNVKVLAIPNRILVPLVLAIICSLVEILLNQWGVLVWEYKYWSWPHIWSILINYSFPMFLMTWVHDRLSIRTKVYGLFAWIVIDVVMWILFVNVLGWI